MSEDDAGASCGTDGPEDCAGLQEESAVKTCLCEQPRVHTGSHACTFCGEAWP